ncbi:hypothetical protein RDI58_006313 [Solanum bulbocastanum]|uniref:Uncharacterized protein n=1 Tax=Solanum bulbocastanum TaxID=147425 RepID=A0AAN8YNB0_SOLBU
MITNGHLTYNNIIFGCRLLMQQLGAPVLRNVCREQKRVADVLARSAFFEPRFLAVPPVYDTLGTTSARDISVCNIHNYGQLLAPLSSNGASPN